MDLVVLEGLEVAAPIGVYPFEHEILQTLRFTVRVEVDLSEAGRSDDLGHALDYDQLAEACRESATARHHRLIERVALQVIERILDEHQMAVSVFVRVEKPGAVPDADLVAVEMQRSRRSRRGLFKSG